MSTDSPQAAHTEVHSWCTNADVLFRPSLALIMPPGLQFPLLPLVMLLGRRQRENHHMMNMAYTVREELWALKGSKVQLPNAKLVSRVRCCGEGGDVFPIREVLS